jgi:hypothetical protein
LEKLAAWRRINAEYAGADWVWEAKLRTAEALAHDFVEVFKSAGCASDLVLPIPGLTPDVQGGRIGVRNSTNLSAEVSLLEKILQAGGYLE